MKFIAAVIALIISAPAVAKPDAKAKPNCEAAAWQVANKFFSKYTKDFIRQGKKDAKDGGYKFDPQDIPGGLQLLEEDPEEAGVFWFQFGERQECQCGFAVETRLNKAKTYCLGNEKADSFSCECG